MTLPAGAGAQRAESPQPGWQAVLIDIDEPLADIPVGGANALYVTARLQGDPLGSFLLPAVVDPFPAALLREAILHRFPDDVVARRRPTWTRARAGVPPPSASVLVCTRDRPEALERCLASLAANAPELRILVVDNGSSGESTRNVVVAAGASYLYEPERGLDRARNRGFAEATTEVVLCTDDDVEVDSSWAPSLLACFDDPLVMAATGLVLAARLDTRARRQFETHAGFSRGNRRRVWDGTQVAPAAAGRVGAGASMAFRTSFVRSVGGFPEELDAGMPTESGGDTYLVYRVLHAGFRAVYEPRAIAFHHHRNDESALARVISGYGTGTFSYLARAATVDGDPAAVLTAVRWAAERFGRDPIRSLMRRPGATPLPLLFAEARGALRTVTAYPAARRMIAVREPALARTAALGEWQKHGAPAAASTRPATATDLPSLSVVIPSRGRRELLTQLVRTLDHQDYPEGRVEIVVVVDGDIDGSAAAVAALDVRRAVRVVVLDPPHATRGAGAAAARNAGVESVTGNVVLFLDDDVEPVDDQLFIAHASRHTAGEKPLALVGPCPPRRWAVDGRHAKAVRNWWVDHMHVLAGDQQLGFADVLTGNFSCRRSDFLSVGGFRGLPRREDWELGHRMMLAGIVVAAAPDAVVLHDADLDLRSAMADRISEGAGDVAFARSHPGVAGLLPLAYWPSIRPTVQFLLTPLFRRQDVVFSDRALDRDVRLLDRLESVGSQRAWAQLYRRTTMLAYWSGATRELESEAELLALLAEFRGRDDPLYVVDLDDLDGTVPESPPTVAGELLVTLGGEEVGFAPVAWGGCPWRRDLLLTRLVERFAARGDTVRAARCAR